MAIKVGGTSVIDNSRNLQNIASVDVTTLAAFTTAGMGDITAVTAGSGLTGGGTTGAVTINHDDTSSQASVNNTGNTVIQDITLDTYGHVTSIGSTTLSSDGLKRISGSSGTPDWNKTGGAAGSFSTSKNWIIQFTLRSTTTQIPTIVMTQPYIAVMGYGGNVSSFSTVSGGAGSISGIADAYLHGLIFGRGDVSKTYGPYSQDLIKLWYLD